MIVALLNQKGGVRKTTLALHLAGEWARHGQRVTLIDADPQGSALDWSQQRSREGLQRLFGVVDLATADPFAWTRAPLFIVQVDSSAGAVQRPHDGDPAVPSAQDSARDPVMPSPRSDGLFVARTDTAGPR